MLDRRRAVHDRDDAFELLGDRRRRRVADSRLGSVDQGARRRPRPASTRPTASRAAAASRAEVLREAARAAGRARSQVSERDPAHDRVPPAEPARVAADEAGTFDFIFCRNVMIYFDRASSSASSRRLEDGWRRGGYLFISHSESLNGAAPRPDAGSRRPCTGGDALMKASPSVASPTTRCRRASGSSSASASSRCRTTADVDDRDPRARQLHRGLRLRSAGAASPGMLHFLLPEARINPERAQQQPAAFADTGIPLLFQTAYEYGLIKQRAIVQLVGGAEMTQYGGRGVRRPAGATCWRRARCSGATACSSRPRTSAAPARAPCICRSANGRLRSVQRPERTRSCESCGF